MCKHCSLKAGEKGTLTILDWKCQRCRTDHKAQLTVRAIYIGKVGQHHIFDMHEPVTCPECGKKTMLALYECVTQLDLDYRLQLPVNLIEETDDEL